MKYHVNARDVDAVIVRARRPAARRLHRRPGAWRGVILRRARSTGVGCGRIVRLKRDIYRLRDHPWTWEAQLQAALLDAGPGAVLSHRSAAPASRFLALPEQNAVEVTGQEQHDHLVTLARFHRSALHPAVHRTVAAGVPGDDRLRGRASTSSAIPIPDCAGRRGTGVSTRSRCRACSTMRSGRVGLTLGQLAAVRRERSASEVDPARR